MGEVYLAQHPRLPRRDALKVLLPQASDDEDFRQRFIREADLAAALSHPNIVTVYDRGECDGQLWIATQHVSGSDVAQILRERYPGGMPVHEAASIVTAIASALDYAHEVGMLHRDVKPGNILCSEGRHGHEQRIALADFGIAREINDYDGMTATNMTLGTVAYAAPEQLMGKPIDGRVDQYALAATAFHLLTGSAPFQNSNPVAVISQHLTVTPPRISEFRPELVALDTVFARALEKDPGQRYPDCVAFARDFGRRALGVSASAEATASALSFTASADTAPTEAQSVSDVLSGSPSSLPLPHKAESSSSRVRRRAVRLAGVVAAALVTAGGIWAVPRLTADHPKTEPGSTLAVAMPTSMPLAASDSAPTTAHGAAEAIQLAVPEVTELIALTEENDVNNLIGRPHGYVAATVLVDSRLSRTLPCSTTEPGVDCGATVEQWPDTDAAQKRADYIQQVRAAMPITGQEWTTVKDNLVLRVTGELKPSDADAYKAVFTDSATMTTVAPDSREALEAAAHRLDVLATQGNAAEAYRFYSQRCKNIIGDLNSYKAFLASWREGRNPQYSGVTVKVNGSSAQVVSIDDDPNAPASTMNPRTWTLIDGRWQFDNC